MKANVFELHRLLPIGNARFGVLQFWKQGIKLFQCDTLENDKLCIPAGEYQVEKTWSPRFHCSLPLVCVPDRQGIRFHAGNFYFDSKGCILVGKRSKDSDCLYDSRFTLDRFLDICGSRFKLIVHDYVSEENIPSPEVESLF